MRKLLTAPEQSASDSEEEDMGRVSTMFETTEGFAMEATTLGIKPSQA